MSRHYNFYLPQGLEPENMYVRHVAVHRACQMRRRTYRAHGRINPYMSTPCHVDLILEEKPEPVEKPESKKKRTPNRNTSFKVTPKKQTRVFAYSAKDRKKAEALKKSGAVDAAAAAPKKSKAAAAPKPKAKKATPGKVAKAKNPNKLGRPFGRTKKTDAAKASK